MRKLMEEGDLPFLNDIRLVLCRQLFVASSKARNPSGQRFRAVEPDFQNSFTRLEKVDLIKSNHLYTFPQRAGTAITSPISSLHRQRDEQQTGSIPA